MATRKTSIHRPNITGVHPEAAIAGGEIYIHGNGFGTGDKMEPTVVMIGDVLAHPMIGSDSFMVVKVPDGASAGDLVVGEGEKASQVWSCDIGVAVAENLHPVTNPAVDTFGNIYTTFSGSRGQKVP